MVSLIDNVTKAVRARHYNLYMTTGPSAELSLEDLVRDVLRAAREPTSKMIAHGYREWHDSPEDERDLGDVYRAMIDEALKDG